MRPEDTAPPGVEQGDGLNAQKHKRLHVRGATTGALPLSGLAIAVRLEGLECMAVISYSLDYFSGCVPVPCVGWDFFLLPQ